MAYSSQIWRKTPARRLALVPWARGRSRTGCPHLAVENAESVTLQKELDARHSHPVLARH